MRCASFFAGVGGIDLGFQQAGFDIIYANEIDKNAVETFISNHNIFMDHRSIVDVKAHEIPDFDVMLAGFPCQAFSIAGYRKGFEDKGRGDLFFELERIFIAKQPSIIFLENVKNLVTHDHGRTFAIIQDSLKRNGYFIKYKILNACEYGNIPQNRERIYIVCFKNKKFAEKFEFPIKIELEKTIKDMLENELDIDKKFFYTNKTPFFNELVKNVTGYETLYQWRRKYVRENKNNLCPTLTANMGTGGHNVPLLNVQGLPETIRKLTPRECFNFQGYPKDFKLPNLTNSHLYKQAGNSVVVPVIKRIAENIRQVISN
ncbi:DNA cytosine methyltransferase [Ursidibacter maritimus]|uniref:DNA (cytosine-5-)-methyltransferase n=5 Tax=Ursidibacter maritimus TaxID=1331689 RepID=A0A949T205_9PAST|nr:DNA cytosine methyltransferase [Ursidibacter maritimus]KAE9540552.1 DNA cytosine methyltransferase [Ursidibacter maritimus]MBV6527346.1 DNA cytosine methyltransferase [Ursidibacter maritimus]MBV6528758.1 DNA cytosine methyltransferase [Ursidibacter maritimus]MBV6530619.1 DNA cytosine methyltransferase [Ursidibacter maritimus]MBV6532731.1 DNA cytosine methyltransferase [Ursidibacter maritimus]